MPKHYAWVLKSVEEMEKVTYYGDFISLLVLDNYNINIARLRPIQCTKISQLAAAFESGLALLLQINPTLAAFDTEMTFSNEVTATCRDLFSDLGLDGSFMDCTELWRCTVHLIWQFCPMLALILNSLA